MSAITLQILVPIFLPFFQILCIYFFPPPRPQALKMRYFSNRPGPTPGHQLPRPNSSAEALKEKENLTIGVKRKRDGLEQSKKNTSHVLLGTNS